MNHQKNQTEKIWYVIYTRSRAEKKVHEELMNNNIESFLPLQRKLRQWKDRKKWVEIPLLSGYCFVNIAKKDYEKVLKINHVVCYITFEGKAAVIPEKQINDLKKMLHQYDFEVTVTNENFKPGKKVEVLTGPLIGLQGELVEARGKNKFILRFEQIHSSFMVEVPADHITLLPELQNA